MRVGYYVNNEYTDETLANEPPPKPELDKIRRNILAEKPRVTRFAIKWDSEDSAPAEYPPEQPDVDAAEDDEAKYGAEEEEEEDEEEEDEEEDGEEAPELISGEEGAKAKVASGDHDMEGVVANGKEDIDDNASEDLEAESEDDEDLEEEDLEEEGEGEANGDHDMEMDDGAHAKDDPIQQHQQADVMVH